MTKAELIDAIAEENGLSKVAAKGALETVVNSIAATLKKEGRIAIPELGTFSVGRREARTGRNPTTGEAIKIKASNTVKFKAAPSVKEVAQKFKVAK